MKPILLKEIIGRAQFDQFQKTVLVEKCPVSLAARSEGKHLFRGSDRQEDYVRYDPTGRTRKSRDSNNFSLLFTETLESWKTANIPPRRHSVIFTGDKHEARGYGVNHLIFFEGDPIIAYGTASDNYNNYSPGFEKSGLRRIDIRGVEVLDDVVNKMFYYFVTYHEDFQNYYHEQLDTETNPQKILELTKLMEDEVGKVDTNIFQEYVNGMWAHHLRDRLKDFFELMRTQGLIDTLTVAYDPDINGLVSKPLSEFFKSPKNGAELWSSGAYYLTPLYLEWQEDPTPESEFDDELKI